MHRLIVVALLVIACGSALPAEKPLPVASDISQQANPEKRGTKDAPLAVEIRAPTH